MLKNPKGSPSYIFRHCDTVQKSVFDFFSKFLVSKGSTFNCSLVLQQIGVCCKRVPHFTVLKTSRFLSLRFSDNFGRSRLVRNNIRVRKFCTKLSWLDNFRNPDFLNKIKKKTLAYVKKWKFYACKNCSLSLHFFWSLFCVSAAYVLKPEPITTWVI